MTHPTEPGLAWNEATVARLNERLNVRHDDDVGIEDWPAAMSDPSLIDAALDAYDRADAGVEERALLIELLLNTFEFCSIERDGNADWRRTLDRIERDLPEHAGTVRRWAEPDDGNPWLISDDLLALMRRQA